jgi:hypothetical protein
MEDGGEEKRKVMRLGWTQGRWVCISFVHAPNILKFCNCHSRTTSNAPPLFELNRTLPRYNLAISQEVRHTAYRAPTSSKSGIIDGWI